MGGNPELLGAVQDFPLLHPSAFPNTDPALLFSSCPRCFDPGFLKTPLLSSESSTNIPFVMLLLTFPSGGSECFSPCISAGLLFIVLSKFFTVWRCIYPALSPPWSLGSKSSDTFDSPLCPLYTARCLVHGGCTERVNLISVDIFWSSLNRALLSTFCDFSDDRSMHLWQKFWDCRKMRKDLEIPCNSSTRKWRRHGDSRVWAHEHVHTRTHTGILENKFTVFATCFYYIIGMYIIYIMWLYAIYYYIIIYNMLFHYIKYICIYYLYYYIT